MGLRPRAWWADWIRTVETANAGMTMGLGEDGEVWECSRVKEERAMKSGIIE